MVEYNAFEVAKQWLYQELGLGINEIDVKKLHSLSFYLDEAYKLGLSSGYDKGYNDGYDDGKMINQNNFYYGYNEGYHGRLNHYYVKRSV